MECEFVGVQLVKDTETCNITLGNRDDAGIIVGSVYCTNLKISCKEFHHFLLEKLPSIPRDFNFLSKKGWSIPKEQEEDIPASTIIHSNLVTIQKTFANPRLGIKWQDGDFIGFMFLSLNTYLPEVRKALIQQFPESFPIEIKFEFLDHNHWPVKTSQEKLLTAWDICSNSQFVIRDVSAKRKIGSGSNHSSCKSTKLMKKEELKLDLKKDVAKHSGIVISYVHREASTHARDLKEQLYKIGLKSVFLDVDNIPYGDDWQDTISEALNSCIVFVALVTPQYGETKWTKREAKLADDMEKLIIPVSFLETWPPDSLAIQFQTLQFIPWKSDCEFINYNKRNGVQDISHWDIHSVTRVANEIFKLYTKHTTTPDAPLTPINFDVECKYGYSNSHESFENIEKSNVNVVISAHSLQKEFVDYLIEGLEKENFYAWSTVNMCNSIPLDNLYNSVSHNSPIIGSYESSPSESLSQSDLSQPIDNCIRNLDYVGNNIGSDCRANNDGLIKEYEPCYKRKISIKTTFKSKIKMASIVILVISKDYCNKTICMQQAFYCEQRTKVIPIKYGDVKIPLNLCNLYSEPEVVVNDHSDINVTLEILKDRIQIKLSEKQSPSDLYKSLLLSKVPEVRRSIGTDQCVYIIGGTSSLSRTAENFCYVLGSELAKIKNLTLVTEGFTGAGELVGKNFCEEREISAKSVTKKISTSVFHVVPLKDNKVYAEISTQKNDGKFLKLPYGQTIFCGNSVSERDDIASLLFKICILIEGGERSTRLVEKFFWNDCTVVPVKLLSRSYEFPEKIWEVPCGVNASDWEALSDDKCYYDQLAVAVKNVISALLKTRKIEQKL